MYTYIYIYTYHPSSRFATKPLRLHTWTWNHRIVSWFFRARFLRNARLGPWIRSASKKVPPHSLGSWGDPLFGGSCKNDGCLLVDFGGGNHMFFFCGGAQVQVRYDIFFFLDVSCWKVIFWCKEGPENISEAPRVFKPNGPAYMDKFGGSLHGTRTWLVGCVNDC